MRYLILLPLFLYMMGASGFGLVHLVEHWGQGIPGPALFIWSLAVGATWPVRLVEWFSQT